MTSELEKQRVADALLEMTGGEERAIATGGGNPQTPPYWLQQLFNGGYGPTSSGIDVNERSALTFTAVYSCVRVLSETMGAIDPFVYRRLPGGGKERVPDHPVYRIIHDEPNDEMVPSGFRQTVMGHICTWGNGYSEKEMTNRGIPVALWPIEPHRVRPDRDAAGNLIYDVSNVRGPNTVFDYDEILHIPGLAYDGIKGYSPVKLAMEAIGLGKAAEVFGSKFFGNGANSSGSLEHPEHLSTSAATNLRESFKRRNAGLDNAFDPLILEEGMKYNRWTIPPNEAQFLETRKFQRSEIASIYRVPPHMIGDLERATFSNIEQQSIDFVTNTMLPWVKIWEQWLSKRLLTPEERAGGLFIEFLITGLLRGDAAARAAYYKAMREGGFYNADMVLEMENMNPQPEGQGQIFWRPANMVDARTPSVAPKADTSNDKPEDKPDSNAKSAGKSAMRIVAMDAAKRIVRKETLAMSRAKQKKDEYRVKSDDFFKDHPAHVIEVLSPVAEAMTSAGMEAFDMNAVACAHVARAKEACAVDVAGWEKAGPVELVQDIFGD
jgi:HK97 family phage portal protein